MRRSEPANGPRSIRHAHHLATALLVGTMAGCGGGDISDVLVAADSATAGNPVNPGSGRGNGTGTGQDSSGGAGSTNTGGGSSGEAYAAGEAYRTSAGALPLSATFNCKSETEAGVTGFERRVLDFEPASGGFFVDGGRVFDGGFTWQPPSAEFVAKRLVAIGTATGEYFAKIDSGGSPTYYRYKLTLRDFSYQQVECYAGLAAG